MKSAVELVSEPSAESILTVSPCSSSAERHYLFHISWSKLQHSKINACLIIVWGKSYRLNSSDLWRAVLSHSFGNKAYLSHIKLFGIKAIFCSLNGMMSLSALAGISLTASCVKSAELTKLISHKVLAGNLAHLFHFLIGNSRNLLAVSWEVTGNQEIYSVITKILCPLVELL